MRFLFTTAGKQTTIELPRIGKPEQILKELVGPLQKAGIPLRPGAERATFTNVRDEGQLLALVRQLVSDRVTVELNKNFTIKLIWNGNSETVITTGTITSIKQVGRLIDELNRRRVPLDNGMANAARGGDQKINRQAVQRLPADSASTVRTLMRWVVARRVNVEIVE